VFDSSGYFLFKFGSSGKGNGQFDNPLGVAVDSTGNIYVSDTDNDRIQVFDSSGKFLFWFGYYGTGNSQFDFPTGISVDSTGNIYVADGDNSRIQVFSTSSAGSPETGGESGGGCSIARGSVNTGEGVANALITLIPIFAFGIGMIIRRSDRNS
jgi:DNA-binding beta-propeller fold protein YncE